MKTKTSTKPATWAQNGIKDTDSLTERHDTDDNDHIITVLYHVYIAWNLGKIKTNYRTFISIMVLTVWWSFF